MTNITPEDPLPPKSGETIGKRIRLPRSRRLIEDALRYSRKLPTQAIVRHCHIVPLFRMRSTVSPRISWATLFMKAYALVAERHRELRWSYMSWPWPHLYEHPYNIARMTVARIYEEERWVFVARFIRPENLTLVELQQRIDAVKNLPIESIPRFRSQLRYSRVPRPLRRVMWWFPHLFGGMRATRFGTIGLTTVSSRGGISIHPPSVSTTTLTFGPVNQAGDVRVTLVYDHRVLDGSTIADFLAELEDTLNGQIFDELQALSPLKVTANR
jgi:hypothetical protein